MTEPQALRLSEIRELGRNLERPDSALKREAESAVAGLSPEDVYFLLDDCRDAYRAHSNDNLLRGCSGGVAAPLVVLLAVGFLAAAGGGISGQGRLIPMLSIGATGLAAGWVMIDFWRRICKYDSSVEMDVIAHLRNPHVVDPLLAHLFDLSPDTREAVRKALFRLLPEIDEPLPSLLFPSARVSLNRILTSGEFDGEFTLRAVDAAGYLGDVSQIKPLERLLRRPAWTDSEKQLHAAAQRSLAMIRERIEAAQNPNLLLRPSESHSDDLLIPSSGQATAESACLLHPSAAAESASDALDKPR